MKYIAGLLLYATISLTLPVEKNTKSFSIFSVLNFPNIECGTTKQITPKTAGLCLTASECTKAGGGAEGNCASGFGVCCYIRVSSDTIIKTNITHIVNPGYPKTLPTYGEARKWTFRVAGNADICQIRLDFDDVVLLQPLGVINRLSPNPIWANGFCTRGTINRQEVSSNHGDAIKVKTSTTTMVGFNELCGTLTGQHIYIHNSINIRENIVEDAATIYIYSGSPRNDTVPNTFGGKRWKIKITLLECGNPSLAEEGCLQWRTELGGRIQSFNKIDFNPITISNLQYNICIRREEGFCGFAVSETRLTRSTTRINDADIQPDSFSLQMTMLGGDAGGAGTVSATDSNCNNEYVGIASTIHDTTRYCGSELTPRDWTLSPHNMMNQDANPDTDSGVIFSDVRPFRISVFSNGRNRLPPTGFDLTYRQTPCY